MDDEDILREEANGHSIFGASRSHRLGWCLGSLEAEKGLPDTAGFPAVEGTVAHSVAEQWLRTQREPRELLGEVREFNIHTGRYEVKIDRLMLGTLHQYVTWCEKLGGDQFIEQRVDYSQLTPIPNQGGTLDHAACFQGSLVCSDLKYGSIWVHARRNPQPMLYGLGLYYKYNEVYDFDRVTLRIGQPRLDNWEEWHTTVAELLEFAEWIKGRFAQAWEPNAPRTPSENACKYCKAKLTCSAYARMMDRVADDTFDDERPLPTKGVPDVWKGPPAKGDKFVPAKEQPIARLVSLLAWRKMFESGFADAAKELERRILAGEDAPGWGVFEGKMSRYVADENGIRDLFDLIGLNSKKLLKTTFASPAQIEGELVSLGLSKKAATDIIAPYVRITPGKDTIGPVGPRKRPARDLADESFDDER